MDQQLLLLINQTWTAQWLDRVMAAASSWDLWWPVILLATIAIVIWGGFLGRAFLLTAGLTIGLVDALIVDTIKDLTGRPRPHETIPGVRTLDLAKTRPRLLALALPLKEKFSVASKNPPRGNSFPSGHAANNFAIAAVAWAIFPKFGWLAFLPAGLVSYSRIYVGSHWPSDILASAILGISLGLLACWLVDKIWQRAGPKWMPRTFAQNPKISHW